jgi:hypothetical protein
MPRIAGVPPDGVTEIRRCASPNWASVWDVVATVNLSSFDI